MSKKVTMQHVADAAGVSKYVVSKAMSGKPGVNADTREHVIQTAVKLGYQFNPRTKSKTSTQQESTKTDKQTIIVLIPNVRNQLLDSLYWGKIVEGVMQELRAQDMAGIVITDQTVDSLLSIVDNNNIHGFIGVGEIATNVLQEVSRLGVPIVLIDHDEPLIVSSQIFVNNWECVFKLTDHLISLGHKKIRFVGNTTYSASFMWRWEGFRDCMEKHGLQLVPKDPLCALNGENRAEHEREILRILQSEHTSGNMPTALVCANDAIAICVINVLEQLGYSVPSEISVTGFDNIEDASSHTPSLTTVNVEKELMGRRAVHMLLEKMKYLNFTRESLLLSASIVYRESTAQIH